MLKCLVLLIVFSSFAPAQPRPIKKPKKPDIEVKVMTADEARKTPFEIIPMKPKAIKQVAATPPKPVEPPLPKIQCPKADLNKSLVIHHIHVGDGDATFLRTPSGLSILVDAGPPAKPNKVVMTLKQCYKLESLDYLILTGIYTRQVGGVPALNHGLKVLRRYDTVKNLPPLYREVFKNPDRVRFQFVQNKNSLGLTVRLGSFDYFIGGDDVNEAKLAETLGDIDVLRANKHGSNSANQQIFLRALSPEHVIISRKDVIPYDQQLLKRLSEVPSVRNTHQLAMVGDVILTATAKNFKINGTTFTNDGVESESLLGETLAADDFDSVESAPKRSTAHKEEPIEEPDRSVLEDEEE